jgi:hypothetical protein
VNRSRLTGPTYVEATIEARHLSRVAKMRDVIHVTVTEIPGRPVRALWPRTRRTGRDWYGVEMRFAVQVEGERRGRQLIENRWVLIRAATEDEARERAERYAAHEEVLYLNQSGRLVRWTLEAILDIYDMIDEPSQRGGCEVFSRLRQRNLSRAFEWHPRSRTKSPPSTERPSHAVAGKTRVPRTRK